MAFGATALHLESLDQRLPILLSALLAFLKSRYCTPTRCMRPSLIRGKSTLSMGKEIVESRDHRRDEAHSSSSQVEEGVWVWDLS